MFFDIALLAYLIDKYFGEFPIKHPVVWMGEFIQAFEARFYQDAILPGGLLVIGLLSVIFLLTSGFVYLTGFLPAFLELFILSVIASTGIAMQMLHDSVKQVLTANEPREALSMLVSRDTQQMSDTEIYKTCVETWAENLSDGVVAPLFYLMLFGLEGLFLYKAINTLDSMVGYKTPRYYRFGRVAARLDDLANYVPARLTALLIVLFSWQQANNPKSKKVAWKILWRDGHKLESPNAGLPISAMASAVGVKLGGDAVYHGKLKHKPLLGDGKNLVTADDVRQALKMRIKFDGFFILSLMIAWILN
ncbi:MAG: cobalamin biosynthesis protein CobD [Candidatus Parabeggiatoa sp. nov. 1]|nr:MAG: cobalamin biosynthesis protein CobD [Gammaproteobacteria bacterium]